MYEHNARRYGVYSWLRYNLVIFIICTTFFKKSVMKGVRSMFFLNRSDEYRKICYNYMVILYFCILNV